MFADFRDKQSFAYDLLLKDIENNCVTHAYLIDENNCSDSFELILSFVKTLLCKNITENNSNCGCCSVCMRIDDGNYPEVKIISPDGSYIKKQQIIDLQHEFSRAAIEGNKRIYIIRDCEKMKSETANSMLKFLEEPEEGIVAILMTNNINNVLSTIVSRCKIIKLNNFLMENHELDDNLENLAINFVNELENKGIETLISIKDIWFSVIGTKDRDKMVMVFDRMVDIYYDVLNIMIKKKQTKCTKWNVIIENISKLNSLDDVLKKINVLLEAKDSIKFNVNSALLIDSVIVSIGGISNGSRC